jgi:uncharacterized protein (UPF0333 family)
MLPKLISTIFTYLNAGGYYKTALEIQNAINTAQLQLYKKLRGNMGEYIPMRPKGSVNFQENNITADSLGELYRVYTYQPVNGIISITSTADLRTPDIVEILEIQYVEGGDYFPVNIVPDNQYLMMKNNKVIYPDNLVAGTSRPLGRMNGLLVFEVYPSTFINCRARVLTLPKDVEFSLVDEGGEVPSLAAGYTDTDFTPEKFNNLLFLTIGSLGFNLSNGVIVQAAAQKEFKEL